MNLTSTQNCHLSIDPRDKKGNPAQLDGIPEWFSSNTDLVTIAPAADGKSCDVSAVGGLGDVAINVSADADLGSGVVALMGMLDITVISGAATNVNITPDTPTEQP